MSDGNGTINMVMKNAVMENDELKVKVGKVNRQYVNQSLTGVEYMYDTGKTILNADMKILQNDINSGFGLKTGLYYRLCSHRFMGFESSFISSKEIGSCDANVSFAHLADKPTNTSYLGKVTVGTTDSMTVTGTALRNISENTNLGGQIQGKVNGDFSSSLLVNYSISDRLDLGGMGTLGSSVQDNGLKSNR